MAKKETARDDELSARPAIRKALLKVFDDVDSGYGAQNQRGDDISDYWEAFNCKLGARQFYNGNSKIFLPFIRDAINARKTRFVNQAFPQSGRYVEAVCANGEVPSGTTALLDHYVRSTKLRTEVAPALFVAGDVEGQYSVYVGWSSTERHVVSRESEPISIGGIPSPGHGEVQTLTRETLIDAGPTVELIADADLLILPETVDSIEEALECGGSVTVRRRWTKDKLDQMKDDGDITADTAGKLTGMMAKANVTPRHDTKKDLAQAAGIYSKPDGTYVIGYETWTKLKVDGDMRLVRAYYAGMNEILGCKLNPYWCDLCPVISAPVEKAPGVFKGRSKVADVIDVQVLANDVINEMADVGHYSAMPIVATDPSKNPRINTMFVNVGAIWEVDPNSTQFMEFPDTTQACLTKVSSCKSQVFQTLNVNPSMVPAGGGSDSGKLSQAEIANQQQLDLLTTADSVTIVENGILTPVIQRFAAYDEQFRNEPKLIKTYGPMGVRAIMDEVDPIQLGTRYVFTWLGSEAQANAARIQQQIAMANVFRGIPPDQYQGYKLNMAPLMTHMAESAFGPRLAPLIFQDMKEQLSMDTTIENNMLDQGFDVMVHPMDDDAAHIKAHMPLMANGDPHGIIRVHLQRHQMQMQLKSQAQQQMQIQQQQGLQGEPGGQGPQGGPQPGVAGTPPGPGGPVMGGQPGQPVPFRGPPGLMRPDNLARAGAVQMPRKM